MWQGPPLDCQDTCGSPHAGHTSQDTHDKTASVQDGSEDLGFGINMCLNELHVGQLEAARKSTLGPRLKTAMRSNHSRDNNTNNSTSEQQVLPSPAETTTRDGARAVIPASDRQVSGRTVNRTTWLPIKPVGVG